MKVDLPAKEAWIKGLSDLLGRPFVVDATAKTWVPHEAGLAAGVYAADLPGAPPQVIWLLDLRAACSLAAGLSMLPVSSADESIRAGRMTEALAENLHEVLNVGTSMIKVTDGRLKLAH